MRAPRRPVLHTAVTIRWGDTVLVSRRLADGRNALVGSVPGSLLPIPCDAFGAAWATVATWRSGAPIALVPEGAIAFHERPGQIPVPCTGPTEIALGPGETVSFSIDAFLITVAAAPAEHTQLRSPLRARAALAQVAPLAAAAAIHALALV